MPFLFGLPAPPPGIDHILLKDLWSTAVHIGHRIVIPTSVRRFLQPSTSLWSIEILNPGGYALKF